MKYFLLSAILTVFLLLTESSGEKKAEKVTGILGESVVFHLKTSGEFKQMFWLRTSTKIFAVVKKEQSCQLSVVGRALKGKLNVSEDCRSLQINDLQQDDSDTYIAQIPIDNTSLEETFVLQVYKNLTESDLEVQCETITLSDGNQTFRLNCSARRWDDDVKYKWLSNSNMNNEDSGKSFIVEHNQDNDLNITCIAKNPIGSASKTVSLKKACKGNEPGASSANSKVISVAIVLAIAVIAAACMGYCIWKKKKRAAHREPRDSPHCTAPDESSKTIYAQIDCLPPEIQQTGTKKPQQRKGPKTKEGPHTIYASVVQPKPVPLQTDDEKIQMEGQEAREKSKKTIYSSITKPQETEDPSIKTVYDTIHAPRCPEESDFHKFL